MIFFLRITKGLIWWFLKSHEGEGRHRNTSTHSFDLLSTTHSHSCFLQSHLDDLSHQTTANSSGYLQYTHKTWVIITIIVLNIHLKLSIYRSSKYISSNVFDFLKSFMSLYYLNQLDPLYLMMHGKLVSYSSIWRCWMTCKREERYQRALVGCRPKLLRC